jgi:hypothetical protein
MHLRFFGPDGSLRATGAVLSALEQSKVGNLFGVGDEMFSITSNEEHAYNAQTEIWYLPESGDPKVVLEVQGRVESLAGGRGQGVPGVAVDRQTYDGVHAETKGRVREFYVWDRGTKSLVLQKEIEQ